MATNIIKFMATVEGHCCVHSFLLRYGINGANNMSGQRAMEIGLKVGISWLTVYRYNARVRDGKYVPCDNCKTTSGKQEHTR